MSNKQINVLLATPCYGNQMLRGYFHSVLKLQEICKSMGVGLDISTIGNESLITRARNYFVSLILSDKKYTHLLFVDADISFDPASVLRMLQSDKDVVAGCYPKKSINWDKIKELIKDDKVNKDFLEQISHDYALNILTKNEAGPVNIPIQNGFMKVSYVATGFLLIKREVLEKMVTSFPHFKYVNDVAGYSNGKNENYFYSIFDCVVDSESKRYLSEDYAFCRRYQQMIADPRSGCDPNDGIWASLAEPLAHVGSNVFSGNILERAKF
jgi:hypothetical protein